jgi:hypothetical protein
VQATFPAPNNAASGYTPLWGVYPAVWTKEATAAGKEHVLKSQRDFQNASDAKAIEAPDGKAFGAPGITVNCPVIAFADKRP